MLTWLKQHAGPLLILSIAAGIIVAIVGIFILVRLPDDHFTRRVPVDRRHLAIRLPLLILKNLTGAVIIILGLIMSLPLVPGPGVIMIIIGLTVTDFPGKRKLELKMLHVPLVLNSINRLRAMFGKPPFQLPSIG